MSEQTGKNALTPLQQRPTLDADLMQFRHDRSRSPAADAVRAKLGLNGVATPHNLKERNDE